MQQHNKTIIDVCVIGASIAGVTAGIYAQRRGLSTKIISIDFGGEVATSGEIENWPSMNQTNGLELAQKLRDQVAFNKIPLELDCVVSEIQKKDKHFVVMVGNGENKKEIQARSIIIATGSRPRWLTVPGEEKFRKRGVTYCTTCDGPIFKGKPVAVVGGGNSALEAGLMMAELSPQVYVLNKNAQFKGDAVLVEQLSRKKNVSIFYNAKTTEILGSAMVQGLRYADNQGIQHKLAVSAVFVHIGMLPNTEFLSLVKKAPTGEIIVDQFGNTSEPGIFAAGDAINFPFRQIVIAAGQGAIAALACVSYLNKQL